MTDPSGGDPTEEQTIPVSRTQPVRRTRSVVDEQTDGSTVIARRETRRRAARDQPEHDGAPVAASARVPPSAPLPTPRSGGRRTGCRGRGRLSRPASAAGDRRPRRHRPSGFRKRPWTAARRRTGSGGGAGGPR